MRPAKLHYSMKSDPNHHHQDISPQIIDLDPAPGQYVMVWVRGVDEIPMSFSGPESITVNAVGDATQCTL